VANSSPTSSSLRFTYIYSILKSTGISTQVTSLNPWTTSNTPLRLKLFKENSPTYFFSQKVVSASFFKENLYNFYPPKFFFIYNSV